VIWKIAEDPNLLVNLDRQAEVADWAGRARADTLRRAVDAIEQAKVALRRNVNPRLILESLFIGLGPLAGHPAR